MPGIQETGTKTTAPHADHAQAGLAGPLEGVWEEARNRAGLSRPVMGGAQVAGPDPGAMARKARGAHRKQERNADPATNKKAAHTIRDPSIGNRDNSLTGCPARFASSFCLNQTQPHTSRARSARAPRRIRCSERRGCFSKNRKDTSPESRPEIRPTPFINWRMVPSAFNRLCWRGMPSATCGISITGRRS